jgi:hypothetical protein
VSSSTKVRRINNEQTGKVEKKAVVSTSVGISVTTVELHTASGQVIETTKGHRIWVEGMGWTPAGQLSIGNAIVTRAGPASAIVRITTKENTATVYNCCG